jgi:DNA topoisomerase-2
MSITANDYASMDLKSHIYQLPDTYAGSTSLIPRVMYVTYPTEDNSRIVRRVQDTLPQVLERIFLEVLTNATDNALRSRQHKIDPGCIDISMDNQKISIYNEGIPIPVEQNTQTSLMAPEMIFGMLLTSSNYDNSKDRIGCGKNGYGAKLTNIFSSYFSVEVMDATRSLHYFQSWNNNMNNRSDPTIQSCTSDRSYVRITYVADFQRFNMAEYTSASFALFERHCCDASYTCGAPVIFNGYRYEANTMKKLVKYYFPTRSNVMYYTSDEIDVALIDSAEGEDTCDNGLAISFVNGMTTPDGGVHVNAVTKEFTSRIVKTLNDNEKLIKHKIKVTNRNVKEHISIIVSARILNPVFSSQTKTKLESPEPKIKDIPESKLKTMSKWNIAKRLVEDVTKKIEKHTNKSNRGRKSKHVELLELEDANMAGTKNSHACTLYITEGKSAMGYAVSFISMMKNGRDIYGILPLRGKPKNMMTATGLDLLDLLDNKELNSLVTALGLKNNVDYRDNKMFNTLRYGRIVIMADSDDDGKHIVGLVLNLFWCLYPTLLYRNDFIYFLRTPIMRIYLSKSKLAFYTDSEYKEWLKRVDPKVVKTARIKYCKGLGSSSDADIKDDMIASQNIGGTGLVVSCVVNEHTRPALELAFSDKNADIRKKWIADVDFTQPIPSTQLAVPISDFIYHEFVEYSRTSVVRSIPHLLDGMKESQRKIVHGILNKWKVYTKKANYKAEKVIRFASFVSERTAYKHGETSLCKAIIHMAQSFTGSNNLPFFNGEGQFGTRNKMGKDASNERYISVSPAWWLPYIIRKEDEPLLTTVVDEDKECEPQHYLPILPLSLLNGVKGIATGHSTDILSHHIFDILQWLYTRLGASDKEVLMKPYFTGYTGKVEITQSKNGKYSVVTTGTYTLQNNMVVVTEIPVTTSIHDYSEFLAQLLKDGHITDFNNNSTKDRPLFYIAGLTGENTNPKFLKLTSTIGYSNIVALDPTNLSPIIYNDNIKFLEAFVQHRLPYFEKRKNYQLSSLQNKIDENERKLKLISLVVNGYIKLYDTGDDELEQQLQSYGYELEYLSHINVRSFTLRKIELLQQQIAKYREEYATIESTPHQQFWLNDLKEFQAELTKHMNEL